MGANDRRAFKTLPEEKRHDIMALSDAYATSTVEKTLEGIVATNVLPKASTGEGGVLCILVSRFNHSCSANAEYLWVESLRCEQVRAARAISPGEEICVNYIGDDIRLPTAERQARLRNKMRFDCRCQLCIEVSRGCKSATTSDQRRARLGELETAILDCRTDPEKGLRFVDEALSLLSEEKISAPRTVAQFCNDGFELALLAGDTSEVQAWAHMSYEAHRLGWGEDYPMTKRMHYYTQNPPSLASCTKSRVHSSTTGSIDVVAASVASPARANGTRAPVGCKSKAVAPKEP